MSSAQASPDSAGVKKVWKKAVIKLKTVLHIKGDNSRGALPDTAPEPATSTEPEREPVREREPATTAAPASPAPPVVEPASISQLAAPPATNLRKYEGATRVPRIQIHEERMKKLTARFGLEIKPSEWHSSEGDVLRVDKPIRIRIRRVCHECNSRFGSGSVCPTCQHEICRQCPKQPDNRTDAQRQANREKKEALLQKQRDMAPILPSYDYSPPEIPLTRPRRGGRQDLVFKGPARMRVRRNCHLCGQVFPSHVKECGCGHVRCHDCPRQPNDRASYPYGFPNDEPGSTFKGVFKCHECKAKFDPTAEYGTLCSKCPHERCPDCPRVSPKKVKKPSPDPNREVLRTIEIRLRNMKTAADSIEPDPGLSS